MRPPAAGVNADSGIGGVTVKGDWRSSSLVAGVLDTTNDGFGWNDTLIPGGDPGIIARIGKVQIYGAAVGSSTPGDYFGITAEAIGRLQVGLSKQHLTNRNDDLLLDPVNGDFRAVDFT